jgi:Flp pilus assembly protein TadD
MSIPVNQSLIAIEGTATYERILALVRDVDTSEAIQHIHDFLKIYPEFSQAHNDIAVLFYRAGNSLKALAHHEKAHKLDPMNITYRKNLADFYFAELEWTDDAIHTYLDILKDNPFDIEALNALGAISLKIGRREQARQYFSRTLQLDGNNMKARQGLQQLGASLDAPPVMSLNAKTPEPNGKEPAARTSIAAFPSISSVAPETRAKETRSSEELYRDAVSLADAGRTDEAILKLEALADQNSDHALAHNDLGELYRKCKDLQRSLRNHEEAVRLKPASADFQKNLADLLCAGSGKCSPEELYREAVSLANAGRTDEAILKLEALVEQNSGHALAHNDLGVLYQKRNDLQRSLRNHEEAVRLKPSSAVFQKNLADLLCVGLGKFEEALRIYVSLQARAPQDIEILKAIAYVCWRVEMPAKARFFLERVLALQPWDHEAQEALMQLAPDAAREELR